MTYGPGAFVEELETFGRCQRWHDVLVFGAQPQRFPARHEHLHPPRRSQQFGEHYTGFEYVFEIVQDE